MKPANASVLRLLRAKGADGLTKAEARAELHIESLTQRVHELTRTHGFDIETVLEQTGDGTRFARYVLHETPTFAPTSGTQEAWL